MGQLQIPTLPGCRCRLVPYDNITKQRLLKASRMSLTTAQLLADFWRHSKANLPKKCGSKWSKKMGRSIINHPHIHRPNNRLSLLHREDGRNVGALHGLADWQIRNSILSSPLADEWRHFLQERRHFSFRFESAPGSCVEEIPRSLDDAADQQHAHSLPFRYSVGHWVCLQRRVHTAE